MPTRPPQNLNQAQGQNKLFGRASYHVAIAYHIHLKRIKEQGVELRQ